MEQLTGQDIIKKYHDANSAADRVSHFAAPGMPCLIAFEEDEEFHIRYEHEDGTYGASDPKPEHLQILTDRIKLATGES